MIPTPALIALILAALLLIGYLTWREWKKPQYDVRKPVPLSPGEQEILRELEAADRIKAQQAAHREVEIYFGSELDDWLRTMEGRK